LGGLQIGAFAQERQHRLIYAQLDRDTAGTIRYSNRIAPVRVSMQPACGEWLLGATEAGRDRLGCPHPATFNQRSRHISPSGPSARGAKLAALSSFLLLYPASGLKSDP
jgi:hypothetical protein